MCLFGGAGKAQALCFFLYIMSLASCVQKSDVLEEVLLVLGTGARRLNQGVGRAKGDCPCIPF